MATILVVDDRPTNRQFLLTLLGYGNHRLLEAADGAQALELVSAERPELVITDILMPTMDGYEFVRRLRATPEVAATKVIFYTATYSVTEAAALAKTCGVEIVLPKPSEPQVILDSVNRLLGAESSPTEVPDLERVPGAADIHDLAKIGNTIADYLGDLTSARQILEEISARGSKLTAERKRIQQIVKRFSENLTSLQRVTTRLAALEELGLTLVAERNPGRMVDLFLGAATRIIGAQHSAIGMLDEGEKRLSTLMSRGFEAEILRESGTDRTRWPASLLESPKPVRLAGTEAASATFPPKHPRIRNVLGLRIATEESVYGWLYFADKLGAEEFNEEDERLALGLMTQLALLYENASLYHLIQHHAAQLQIEVSERRQAQALVDNIVENIPTAVQVKSVPEFRIMLWNKAAEEVYGLPREEAIGRNVHDLWPKSDADRFHAADLDLVASGRIQDFPNRPAQTKNRGEIRVHMRKVALLDAAGKATHLLVIADDITSQLADEARLRESEERFRSLSMLSSDWFWEQDEQHRFVKFSGGEGVKGWGPDQSKAIGLHRWDLGGVIPISCSWEEHKGLLDAHKPFRNFEYRRVLEDGRLQYVEASGEPIFDGAGRFTGYRGVATEITQRKAAEAKIRRLNRVYAVLSGINTLIVRARRRDELFNEACRIAVKDGQFRMAWIGLVDHDSKRLRPVASDGDVRGFFDSSPVATMPKRKAKGKGLSWQAVTEKRPVIANDVQADPQTSMKDECRERGINSLVMLPLVVGGDAIGVLALYAAETGFFDDEEMRLLVELAGDISFALDHLQKAEKLNYLAYYDELTGLANRTLFHERLSQHVSAAGAGKAHVAVVILDIERFKSINDALGRQMGDALLKQVAGRMRQHSDDPARLARISADHFAVVVPGVQSEEEFARRAEQRMHQYFDEPFRLGDSELRVAARAGVAMYPDDGADAETLFRNAEAALKKAKTSGDKILFYTQQMTERVAGKLALENKLRLALEREEFVLHYQPKVNLETGKIAGVEALIRWQTPDKGLVPPGQFIPLLEETGLILQVGSWALKRASLDHRGWVEQGLKPPRVAVNVSAIQLRQRDFVEVVEQAIIEGVAPTGIDLEITESLVMEDIKGNIEKLKAVCALGVNIAVDDFGTGYSSLGYLAKLPVQFLKIDRSFIITMHNDPNAMTLVSMIISLAHSLRLKVVAEGVETEEQAKFLRLLRCDEMQGYLFSKPVPAEVLVELLRKNVP